MKSLQHFAFILSLVLLAAALPGCFITTQSFNHGKLLNPGERIITHGFGWRYASRIRPYTEGYDSADYLSYRSVRDSTRFGWGTYTLDYRVGILRTRPFGKGLETGFHLEAAFGAPQRQIINYTCDYSGNNPADSTFDFTIRPRIVSADTQVVDKAEFYGPPTLEIDTRLGLSDIVMRKCIMHHNVSAGWTIGYWVDNGWFAGYAAGWEFSHFIPYCSGRVFLAETDALNRSIGNSDNFTTHNRKWGGRLTGGVSCRLPSNFSIVPEFITPEVSFTFPNYAIGQRIGFNASLGIRWMMGQ